MKGGAGFGMWGGVIGMGPTGRCVASGDSLHTVHDCMRPCPYNSLRGNSVSAAPRGQLQPCFTARLFMSVWVLPKRVFV